MIFHIIKKRPNILSPVLNIRKINEEKIVDAGDAEIKPIITLLGIINTIRVV